MNHNLNKEKALNNLYKLFHERDYTQSKEISLNLLKKYPKELILFKILGFIFKNENDIQNSILNFNEALSIKSDDTEIIFNLAILYQLNLDHEKAEINYLKLIRLNKNHIDGLYNLAVLYNSIGRIEEAKKNYLKIIEIDPKHTNSYNNLGLIYLNFNKIDKAIKLFINSIKINPNNYKSYNNLGISYKNSGDFNKAETNFIKSISLKPNNAVAYYNLSLIKHFDTNDKYFKNLTHLSKNKNNSNKEQFHYLFSLAKTLEDTNNFNESYKFYNQANIICKKISNYNPINDSELFKKVKDNFSIYENYKYSNNINFVKKPIFILGMPRSGSTITEQILSSHKDISAGGELNYVKKFGQDLLNNEKLTNNLFSNFSTNYLNNLIKHSNEKPFVTDKMPFNFLYVGLLLKVFPDIKIIHTKRNPPSVCWSIFTKYFPNKDLNFSNSLKDIIHYYKLYDDLMNFWNMKFQNKIYSLNYEKLVSNQLYETRNLLNYLELPWDENCLYPEKNKNYVSTASSVQVRKKLFKNKSDYWKKFKPFFDEDYDFFNSFN